MLKLTQVSLSLSLFLFFCLSNAWSASDVNGDRKDDLTIVENDNLNIFQLSALGQGFRSLCTSDQNQTCGIDRQAALSDPKTKIIPGDFDGDGKTEYLIVSASRNYPLRALVKFQDSKMQVICENRQNGSFIDYACGGLDIEDYMTDVNTRYITGNFNGDRKTDLLIISGKESFPRIMLFYGDGTRLKRRCGGLDPSACGIKNDTFIAHPSTKYLSGDIDGDGISDLLIISGSAIMPEIRYYSGNTTGFNLRCFSQGIKNGCGIAYHTIFTDPNTRLFLSDITGDGISELIVISGMPSQGIRSVYSYNRTRFTSLCRTGATGNCGLPTSPYMFNEQTRYFLDNFSSGTKASLLVLSGDPTNTYRSLYNFSNGAFRTVFSGTSDGTAGFDTEGYSMHPRTQYLTGDFNGDSLKDVVGISGDPTFGRKIVLLSRGNRFQINCALQGPGACGLGDLARPTTRFIPQDGSKYPSLVLASMVPSNELFEKFADTWARFKVGEIIFDGNPSRLYHSGPLKFGSNVRVKFEPGVILEARSQSFPRVNDSLINIKQEQNIQLIGSSGAEIRMKKAEYTNGQWRHAISILASNNITIEDLKISDSGGDGIYLGSVVGAPSNQLIELKNLHLYNNSRNGLSVININGLLVKNCQFTHTNPLSPEVASGGPWAGIDLEPNTSQEMISNVVIEDSVFSNNKGPGVQVALGTLANSAPSNVSISIERSQFHTNDTGLLIGAAGGALAPKGTISLNNSSIVESNKAAIELRNKSFDGPLVDINNVTIQRANLEPNPMGYGNNTAPIVIRQLNNAGPAWIDGNVNLNKVFLEINTVYPTVWMNSSQNLNEGWGIKGIRGQIYYKGVLPLPPYGMHRGVSDVNIQFINNN